MFLHGLALKECGSFAFTRITPVFLYSAHGLTLANHFVALGTSRCRSVSVRSLTISGNTLLNSRRSVLSNVGTCSLGETHGACRARWLLQQKYVGYLNFQTFTVVHIFAVFFFLGDYPASCLKFKPKFRDHYLMTGQIVVPKRWFKF
jgi:hypothetical protein